MSDQPHPLPVPTTGRVIHVCVLDAGGNLVHRTGLVCEGHSPTAVSAHVLLRPLDQIPLNGVHRDTGYVGLVAFCENLTLARPAGHGEPAAVGTWHWCEGTREQSAVEEHYRLLQ
jgi:hypothetical protein